MSKCKFCLPHSQAVQSFPFLKYFDELQYDHLVLILLEVFVLLLGYNFEVRNGEISPPPLSYPFWFIVVDFGVHFQHAGSLSFLKFLLLVTETILGENFPFFWSFWFVKSDFYLHLQHVGSLKELLFQNCQRPPDFFTLQNSFELQPADNPQCLPLTLINMDFISAKILKISSWLLWKVGFWPLSA